MSSNTVTVYTYVREPKKLQVTSMWRRIHNCSCAPLSIRWLHRRCCIFRSESDASTSRKNISEKRDDSYSDTMNYIRTKLSFALLRSSILCLRGCRTLKKSNHLKRECCNVFAFHFYHAVIFVRCSK